MIFFLLIGSLTQHSYAGSIHPLYFKKTSLVKEQIAQMPSQEAQATQATQPAQTTQTLQIKQIKETKQTKETKNIKDIKDVKNIKNDKNKENAINTALNLNTSNLEQIKNRDQQDVKRAQALRDVDIQSEGKNINTNSEAMTISFKDVVSENRILAVVNNNMLTQNDAQNYLKNLKNQAVQNQIAWYEPRQNIEKIILPRLIIDKIQMQRARDIGLKIDDAQMQAILEGVAQKQGLTLLQMRDHFNQQGVDFIQYVNEMRQGILLNQLQEREFASTITVSPQDIQNYSNQYFDPKNTTPTLMQTKLRHIVLRKDSGEADLLKKQLQEVQEKIIQQRQSFETMALIYSQDSTAAKGGYLGGLFPEEMPVGLEQAIQGLAIGKISGVLESSYGYHIVQILERKNIAIPSAEQNELITSILKEKKIEAAYQNWLKKLRENAYVNYKL